MTKKTIYICDYCGQEIKETDKLVAKYKQSTNASDAYIDVIHLHGNCVGEWDVHVNTKVKENYFG